MTLWLAAALAVALVFAALRFGRRLVSARGVMTAHAKSAVDDARREFQVDLDFSEASVQRLEEIVAKHHEEYAQRPGKPSAATLTLYSNMWGAYLGEVIRKHHGGDWSQPSGGLFGAAYVLTVNGTQMSPPSKVYKRIVNGDEDNLYRYYLATIRMVRGELRP